MIWHALFKYLYIYTYRQSGHRWWSSIIGGAPGDTHWDDVEMHHLEAVVVKRQSWKSESPTILYHTSRDIRTELVAKSNSSSRLVWRRWEDMILPGRDDPCNGMDPRNLGKSEWDQKLGQIECVLLLYDKMGWCLCTLGCPEYILPDAHSTSVTPVSPYKRRCCLQVYMEAVIEQVWRCSWRPGSSELRDALRGRDRASIDMNWEATTERGWRCNWRLRLSELRDPLWGRDWASLEMHWEDVILCVWRCTWRPRLSELTDALGGLDRARLEVHMDAVIERVWTCTCRLWSSEIGGVLGVGWFGGRHNSSWDSIHWLTCDCGNEESWVQQHPPTDEKLAGSRRQWILAWWCTCCMLYSVLTHDHGMERSGGMTQLRVLKWW